MSDSNDSWLDLPAGQPAATALVPAEVGAIPTTYPERLALVESCWARLSVAQRTFLQAWKDCRYNARAANRQLFGRDYTSSRHTAWCDNADYATVMKVWLANAGLTALDKDRLLARQDDIVETLLEPKPILHQGVPTGFEEVNAGAAARANETLMKAAGLLKDKEIDVNVGLVGPELTVQIVQADGKVIDATPKTVAVDLPIDAEFTEVKE